MSRPKKPTQSPDKRPGSTIIVRLSDEQRAKLVRLVGQRGPLATMTDVIRDLIEGAKIL